MMLPKNYSDNRKSRSRPSVQNRDNQKQISSSQEKKKQNKEGRRRHTIPTIAQALKRLSPKKFSTNCFLLSGKAERPLSADTTTSPTSSLSSIFPLSPTSTQYRISLSLYRFFATKWVFPWWVFRRLYVCNESLVLF